MPSSRFLNTVLTFLVLMAVGAQPIQADELTDHFHAAQQYMLAKQWDFANYEWRSILAQQPTNQDAVIGLSKTLEMSGLVDEAIAQLEYSSMRLPPNTKVDTRLAQMYAKTKKFDKAEFLYKQVLARSPKYVAAYEGLNDIVPFLPKDRARGVNALLNFHSQQAVTQGREAWKKANFSEAASAFKYASLRNQNNPSFMNEYALALLFSGQSEQAISTWRWLIRDHNYWQLRANLGLAYLAAGKNLEGRNHLERALAMNPSPLDKSALYNILGYLYEMNGTLTRSQAAYERALQLNPNAFKAKKNLAYVFHKQKNYRQALATYQQLVKKFPKDADLWTKVGFEYEHLDRPKQAIAAYEKACLLAPTGETPHFHLASLYKKLDKAEKATQVYKNLAARQMLRLENGMKPDASVGKEDPFSKLTTIVDVFQLTPARPKSTSQQPRRPS